jgi:DNA repair protein SbcD/Mre11
VHAAEAVSDSIAALLQGFGAVNRRLRERGVITVGVSHGTVNGCITEHGVPMAGLDHEFTVGSLFAAETSAFMLGHIHRHQAWEASGHRIAYPGSIGRLHYGEEGDKGFLIWDVARDSAAFEFVLTPARRMLHIDFQGKPDLDKLKTRLAEADGAFVRVRWVIPEEDRASVDRDAIRALLSKAAEVKLEERVVPVVRTRAAGITQAHTLSEKLAKWAGTTEVEEAPLLERLQLLESTEPETIVGELLREQKTSVNLDRSEKHMNFHNRETDQREPGTSGKVNEAAGPRLQTQLAETS